MENIQKVRLQLLHKNFRQKANVKRGFNELSKLIFRGEEKKMNKLLRNHWQEPILYDYEVKFRDDVDFLIGYYSLLAVGIVSGYIPETLDKKKSSEAIFILSHPAVKKYYKKNYRLYLPQILLNQLYIGAEHNEKYFHSADEKTAETFERFLLLLRIRMDDNDIDQFLWFLDDGSELDNHTDRRVDIDDLWFSLQNFDSFRKAYLSTSAKRSPLRKGLMGFIKFVTYLDEYEDLLNTCKHNKLFQSAIWHMEAYWFDNLKTKLGDVLKKGIQNMSKLVSEGHFTKIDEDVTKKDIKDWQDESKKQVDKAMHDINFLFNKKLGRPILELLNDQNKKLH